MHAFVEYHHTCIPVIYIKIALLYLKIRLRMLYALLDAHELHVGEHAH